jgi:ABC-type branched-subunit amino acid transport system permease subunit
MSNIHRLSLGWLIAAGALAILLLFPPVLGRAQLALPTEVCIFGIFALTYDLIFGYVGLISFGHAIFVGFGSYALSSALTDHGVAFWPALLIVLIAGIAISTLSGVIALRTRGVYFAMVTLAFAQAAFTLAESDVGGLTSTTWPSPRSSPVSCCCDCSFAPLPAASGRPFARTSGEPEWWVTARSRSSSSHT